tara:strand:- start:94868 stop:96181 length:1314 start_codon:yes stop_codon:yes gene_type:complete
MDWQQEYNDKRISTDQAVEQIIDINNLILGMSMAMPPGLLEALGRGFREDRLPPLNIYYMHGSEAIEKHLLVEDLIGKFTPRCLFLSGHDRKAGKELSNKHWMEFVPASFHHVGRLLTEHIEPDCFMVTVSPMDRHGYFSLGTNADYGASVIRKAKRVIVEVNRHMPRTFGECSVHISEIDALVEHDAPLGELLESEASETDWAIARQVAEYIQDGDTLQMGVGGVPASVLKLLENHKNLGLHSELFCPSMVNLIAKGVINGRKKRIMQHKHVYTLALGDKAMYDFMDDNPSIVGYPASWVNDPCVIRQNSYMVSVNSAIEVDITGQINAETIKGTPFSGTGGQLDFVRGAFASHGGRSFIALHSTAKQGSLSRIVPCLTSTVTDTRMDAHYVVTEFGCVELKGLSLAQRARALIGIAHPHFRDELEAQARSLGLFG